MNDSRWVYKWHKWLAVSVSALTLMWFVSSMVMLLPVNFLGTGNALEPRVPAGPRFQEAQVGVPQAIAALETEFNKQLEVTSVKMRRLAGRLLYEIAAQDSGPYLVDALEGKLFVVTEAVARRVAAEIVGTEARGEVVLLREHTSDYLYGRLPVYRVQAGDSRGTLVYVDAATGETRSTNRLGRIRGFLAGMHTLMFLQPTIPWSKVRVVLSVFSVVGTFMTLFGMWILWLHFQNWRIRRKTT